MVIWNLSYRVLYSTGNFLGSEIRQLWLLDAHYYAECLSNLTSVNLNFLICKMGGINSNSFLRLLNGSPELKRIKSITK